MKTIVSDLAMLGGHRLFDRFKPTGQLDMPNEDLFIEKLKGIYDRRQFTNNGRLQRDLEQALAEMHETTECITFSNGCTAILGLLKICSLAGRDEVILPSFTYRGLPHLIRWAGKIPRFADVSIYRHTLDPRQLALMITKDTSCILAVNHVTGPADIDDLNRIALDNQIPIFYDSVYAMGCTYHGKKIGGFGLAEVFSLHATKLLNGFEGGYVTTNDSNLARALRELRNFCFSNTSPDIIGIGFNGKLNEIHAAMALAGLENFHDIKERNILRYNKYVQEFSDIPGIGFARYDDHSNVSYELVLIEILDNWPFSRKRTIELLRAENALVRPYYYPPLHLSANIVPDTEVLSLPISEYLAQRFIQMPVGSMVSLEDISRLASFFKFVLKHSEEINHRLDVEVTR